MAPCGGPSSGPTGTATSTPPPSPRTRRATATCVSVCLPARDEAATVGPIVEQIRTASSTGCGLVDEVLVMDDHSTDDTARIAADAGARVLAVDDVLPELGPGEGKGEALYKSVAAARGDLIAWCDADIREFAPHFVVGLVGPLLTRSDISFVKGFYDRPVDGQPARRRAGHRADGPARDRGAVPPPGLDRAAAVGRVRRPPVAARAAAVRAGLRRRPRPARSTSPRSRAPRRSPRSTSGCAATATGRSTSSVPRRWPCSRPPSAAPATAPSRRRHPRAARPGARGGARRRAARPRRRVRLPPPHRVDRPVPSRFRRRSFGLGKSLKVTTQSGRWCW